MFFGAILQENVLIALFYAETRIGKRLSKMLPLLVKPFIEL